MLRARMVRFVGRRALAGAVAALLLIPALLFPTSAVANDPPVVTNGAVTPSTLTYLGGTVMVTAEVTDDSNALNIVYADITGPYNYGQVALSQGPDAFQYFGTVELPANFTPDPINWEISVVARDLDNVESAGFAGEVQVDGQPPFDEPPVVADPAVSPRSLPSAGGPVTLAVSASDLRGISEAYAVITGPAGGTTQVPLDPISSDRFEGVFSAPANVSTSPIQYSVEMTALDDIGQPSTVDAGLITVAGRPTGRLRVRPAALPFGATQVGTRALRAVVVRNVGARSTVPVAGVVTISGASFAVVGAPAAGLQFRLRAGQQATFLVRFRPTVVGVRYGTLRISRPDLVQPALSVPLSGRGIPHRPTRPPV